MAAKAPNIGLSQAQRLCQMPQPERLAFIAEGLPVVLASARGFWRAARQLEKQVREAVVLERHAEEEAAKVLILMDIARCPKRLRGCSAVVRWKPMHVAQLREYVDLHRKSHHVDGTVGEYTMPNSTIFNREGLLYADIAAYEEEGASWSDPADLIHPFSFSGCPPTALKLAESMSRLGMFTQRGVDVTAEVWGSVEFKELESFRDADALTRTLLERLLAEDLPTEEAEDEDVQLLYGAWQLPMYHFDFGLIEVPLEDLRSEQEALLRAEIGGDYY